MLFRSAKSVLRAFLVQKTQGHVKGVPWAPKGFIDVLYHAIIISNSSRPFYRGRPKLASCVAAFAESPLEPPGTRSSCPTIPPAPVPVDPLVPDMLPCPVIPDVVGALVLDGWKLRSLI